MSSIHEISPNLQARLLRLSRGEADGLIYIEQFQKTSECTTPNRPLLKAINHDQKTAILFHPPCKMWSCPVCADLNKRRWIARALHGVQTLLDNNQALNFLTLTSHEKLRGRASFTVWPSAWKKLQSRYYYAIPSGERFYFAVPERHQDGTKHTHAIITGILPERWWKDNARACGMGFMADVQEVITLGVGGYVGKYIGKTLAEGWPKRTRRVNTSRSWPSLPEPEQNPDWKFIPVPSNTPIQAIYSDLTRAGLQVAYVGPSAAYALINEFSGGDVT